MVGWGGSCPEVGVRTSQLNWEEFSTSVRSLFQMRLSDAGLGFSKKARVRSGFQERFAYTQRCLHLAPSLLLITSDVFKTEINLRITEWLRLEEAF